MAKDKDLPQGQAEPQAIAEPQAAHTPVYPLDHIFDRPVFRVSDNNTIYTRERDGQKSKQLANVVLAYRGTGVGFPGTIYGRQVGTDKPVIEFVPVGSMRATSLVAFDEPGKELLSRFKKFIAAEYVSWVKAAGPSALPTKNNVNTIAADGLNIGL